MSRPVRLPAAVTLPSAHGGLVSVGAVWNAMGVSRQWGALLRKRHGFPAASSGAVDVRAVGAWLSDRAVRVDYV